MSDRPNSSRLSPAAGAPRRRRSTMEVVGRSVALLMTLAACGRSSGCSGCNADGPPFPDKDKVQSAIQVRLTDNGVGFLEENLEPLLSQALPDGLNVCLPGQGGDILGLVQYGFCQDQCQDGNRGCPITIGIGGVDLQLVQPSTIRATVTFSDLLANINVFATPLVDCTLTIDGAGFPVSVDLNLSTPEPTRDLTFAVANPAYALSDLDIHLQGNDGFLSPLCSLIDGAINFPVIGDFLLGVLQGFIDGQLPGLINGFLEDFTCRTCEGPADCPVEGGASCEGGRCMANGVCLPAPLGVHGVLDLGSLLGGFSPGLEAQLQYLLTPGSYVQVENEGLSLGVIGGARADKARCVPPKVQPPTDVEPPRAVALQSNIDPAGRPYEVGIGISDLFLDHGMWAFFTSGGLCLGITNDKIDQLNPRTLGVLLRDLNRLTRGNQSLAITLSPQEVPIATIGGNVVVPDPENEGQYLLQDPLLTITLPDLWLDFHAFIEDRWVRIFSLNADIEIPLGIAFDPGNGIIPVLGDLGQAIRNVEVANGEVMRDSPQALANLIPVLLGPLLPQLASGLTDPIALPDIMGYQLDLQEHSIQGIENNTFLGIFANLERAPAGAGNMIRFGVDTTAEVLEVHAPAADQLTADAPDFWKRTSVRLKVDAFDAGADEAPMEFQWRVDGGTWSLFTPAREMVVRNPMLALQGRHLIEVRARRMDDYHTLDLTPAEVEVLVDSLPPTLALDPQADRVRISVDDVVSARDAIEVSWRRGETGAFEPVEVSAEGEAFVPAPGAEPLHVRAVDEAGNVSEEVVSTTTSALIGRQSHDERAAGAAGGGCGGCAVPRRTGAPAPLALLGLLPLHLVLRRRARAAARANARSLGLLVALAALAALLGACNDSTGSKKAAGDAGVSGGGDAGGFDATPFLPDMSTSPPGDCTTDEDCPDGKVCREVASQNKCIALTCNDDPALCDQVPCESGRTAICAATGLCECEQPCPDGCPEGQYCCRAEYKCAPMPDACKDMACEPGYEPMVLTEGHANEETCMVEGVECSCVEKHPLDPGSIGRYSDFVLYQGQAFFSAYADAYGDLVVGHYDADTHQFTWWWVDGVPSDGEVVGGPSGARGGIQAAGEDVGTDTSIAVGPGGNLHVAYRDVTHKALKYALGVRDGDHFTWTVQTLDAEGDAGRWTSISVDARGVPGIAYRVARHREGEQWVSLVRYALAKNDAPGEAADWLPPFTVAQSVLDGPCGGLCGQGEVCLSANQTCAVPGNGCGACADTEACVAGMCQAVVEVPPPPSHYPEGTGLFTAQTRDPAGAPVVAWYDRTFGQLWWAKFGDAGFEAPAQLAGYGIAERDGDMGSNVDVAVDGRGNFHLCYQDGSTDSVRYLAPELGLDEWVDDGTRTDDGRQWAVHVVGEDCNVRFDPAGNPVLVYQDATSQDVVLNRRSPEGAWSRTVVRGNEFEYGGAFGFYTRARVDGAKLWIGDYWWNNQDPAHPDGIDVTILDL